MLVAATFATSLSACTTSAPPLGISSVAVLSPEEIIAANEVELDVNGDPVLPETVSYYPSERPDPAVAAADQPVPQNGQPASVVPPDGVKPAPVEIAAAQSGTIAPANTVETAEEETAEADGADETAVTADSAEPETQQETVAEAPVRTEVLREPAPAKKRGFFASLFTNDREPPIPVATAYGDMRERGSYASAPKKTVISTTPTSSKPKLALASLGGSQALPGVRERDLFEITRRSGLDDDSDIDGNETEDPIRLASAAGMARLAPNGLLTQHGGVDVKCLKPALVRVLKTAERRYGRRVVITSGYRSPQHNRRVRGARNSLHMYCAAADIQIEGVSKWALAKYLRSMPGRGGVGTYCHTNSVHIDVGPERDWNWRCRRRRKRK